MKLLFILLSVISLSSAHTTCGIRLANNRFERSIIGGNSVTSKSKWPWQVSVNECGGTIVSEQWVLTAAHCVNGGDASNVTVTAGVTRIDGSAKELARQALAVYAHSKYDSKTMENDIALVKLETPLDYSNAVAPICLPAQAQSIPRDGQAVVTGFGIANFRGTNETVDDYQLRETVVPIIPPEVCDERYSNLTSKFPDDAEGRAIVESWSKKKIVCAGSLGHGASHGDSGGPLMMKASDGRWFQIGIVSFGVPYQHAFDTYPNAYTDVRAYCDWINETTKGDASCQEDEVTLEDVEIMA